ncbi:MAG: POTRA domain-containing protein, partial [Thermoanaerobaculia bacterium]
MRGAGATVFAAALSAAAVLTLPAHGAELPDLWGRNVESVAYAADGEVNQGEIEALISIAPGRPLLEEETGATIRNLYGTRLFSNVVVDAEPVESGDVRVIIYLWRAYVVRGIEFEGKFGPTREDLRRVVPLAAGDPFHAAALEAGTSAIERRLFADGYLDPQVEPEAVFDRETFTVTALYRIQAGERARITEPFFDGKTAPFTAAELAKSARLKLDPGDVYNETKAREDAERMRKYLLGQGFYRGAVELIAA